MRRLIYPLTGLCSRGVLWLFFWWWFKDHYIISSTETCLLLRSQLNYDHISMIVGFFLLSSFSVCFMLSFAYSNWRISLRLEKAFVFGALLTIIGLIVDGSTILQWRVNVPFHLACGEPVEIAPFLEIIPSAVALIGQLVFLVTIARDSDDFGVREEKVSV